MVKGRKRNRKILSVEDILASITEYEIFRYYLGHDFKPGKPFSSPFRNDRHPSCSIDRLNNGLYFVDWANTLYRGDCIDFVKLRFNCSLPEALKIIDQDFGLGITSGEKFNIRKVPMYKIPKMDEKKPSLIQFTGNQKFSRSYEAAYWNAYRFSFDILRAENTYCVRSLYIDKEKFILPKDEPVFAYYEPDIQKVKIYRPLANKEKKEWKWRSTIPFTHMHGLNKMRPCQKIVTFKSNKDRICGLHFLDQALAVQGESLAAISAESLARMQELSDEQYLCFGTDPQGKKESHLITGQMGMKHINMPDHYLPANDPAEVGKQYSIEVVRDHFAQKGLLPQFSKTA